MNRHFGSLLATGALLAWGSASWSGESHQLSDPTSMFPDRHSFESMDAALAAAPPPPAYCFVTTRENVCRLTTSPQISLNGEYSKVATLSPANWSLCHDRSNIPVACDDPKAKNTPFDFVLLRVQPERNRIPSFRFVVWADWLSDDSKSNFIRKWYHQYMKKYDSIDYRINIRCRLYVDGKVAECSVLNEEPQASGVGQAAATMISRFQFRPMIVDGRQVPDSFVYIPMRHVQGTR